MSLWNHFYFAFFGWNCRILLKLPDFAEITGFWDIEIVGFCWNYRILLKLSDFDKTIFDYSLKWFFADSDLKKTNCGNIFENFFVGLFVGIFFEMIVVDNINSYTSYKLKGIDVIFSYYFWILSNL